MTAHREAVETALGFLEEHAAVARMQVDGLRRHVSTHGWVVAGFVHRTSREGDPQLHTHCLVPNVVRRGPDGRCVALAARPLFVWARAAGSIYQAELQRALSLRLGVEWGPDRSNTRELAGFTPAPVAGVLETDGGDRGRARSPRRPLRVAGVADAGRRRGVAGHPAGQGPLAHPEPARRSLAGRGRKPSTWRWAGSWIGGCAGGTRRCADRRRTRRSSALWSTRTPACAPTRRGSTNPTSSNTSPPSSAGRLTVDEIRAITERFLDSDARRAADARPRRRRGGSRPAGRPPPTAPSRTRRSRLLDRLAGPARLGRSRRRRRRLRPGLGADQQHAVSTSCAVPGAVGAGGARPGRPRQDGHGPRRRRVPPSPTAGRWSRWRRPPRRSPNSSDAGLPASTIARFRLDLERPAARRRARWWCSTRSPRPRPATLHTVLAAVAACPGWPAVGAGRSPPGARR